ncbi:RNA polymerase sigma factor [Amycolatopsis thermophila]|uniref:RNA polymerase sigma-70 factor (ECF subfamily) n=1 Tax=Amycolatopsis thermophila TaxID=206084 RepID=A0ABU0EU25_9PSEU|nr:sigma-70 family RNA polymerase sigma factor [Amycolatopsis thermophila]MDQ0378813.1 RNA polymerase sigma-70 factor (ECF subfamily) [Amycolatopsis thermophila]
METGDAVARLVREEGTRVLATLIRVTGSVDVAEDAVQDAVVRALETWPRDGVPDNPRGWLLVTAKRRAVDLFRREAARSGKEAAAMPFPEPEPAEVVRDDLLRLVFTCCHPALSLEAQVALALRTLGGLSTAEVARALLVPEATMAKRLTRAKQKIAQARIPYRVPDAAELPDRLTGVAATVYLIFNEGYAAAAGSDLVRLELVDEAVRLARLLAGLMPDEPTVLGLLALLLLQNSRRDARVDAAGVPVLLPDQDRSRWDVAAIKEGVSQLGRGLRRAAVPDRYVVQAAIAACHALAPSYAETNWDALISWYDVLLEVADTPVARLNRAVAVAERDGPAAGLALVDGIPGLTEYPWWHATRGELLNRLGAAAEARTAYRRALALGLSDPQAAHLRTRLADLG